jgi:hypothetical protein
MWWFRAYSTLVQTYTYDVFFLTPSNSPAPRSNNPYIWFVHYTHKVAGSRLFDHKKPIHMTSCLSVVRSCFLKSFFHFLLLLLLFITFINYFLLLRRARVCIVFILRGGKGCTLIYFLLFFLLLRGEGGGGLGFFSPFIGNVEGASAPISDPQEKICSCICALAFCWWNKWALCCLLMVSVEVSLHFGLPCLHFFSSLSPFLYYSFPLLTGFFFGAIFPNFTSSLLCLLIYLSFILFFRIFFNLCQCLSFYSSILSLVS